MGNESALQLEAPWVEVKERIKEVSSELTDEDLRYIPGRDEQFLQQLGQKLHRSPAAIKAWIESISSNRGKSS